MKTSIHVKKGNHVLVLRGKDRGKLGEVIRVFRNKNKVFIKGVNLKTHHKKLQEKGQSGISYLEGPIHVSNVSVLKKEL